MSWPARAEHQTSAPWPAIRPVRRAAWMPPRPARPALSPWMPPSPAPAPACLRSGNSPPSTPAHIRCPDCQSTPAMYALLPARWQSSRATSGVSFVPAGRVISCKVFATSLSESTFRKGDCRRETLSAVFSVSSKIASPVLLAKSARTIVSFSVSACALWEIQSPLTENR